MTESQRRYTENTENGVAGFWRAIDNKKEDWVYAEHF